MHPPRSVLLVSCYELGHQPLGIAWPRAFLERAEIPVEHADLAVEELDEATVRGAGFVGISVPMHTALRLGVRAAERIRALNPTCFICFYGLYAVLNRDYLLHGVADAVLAGEVEGPLVALVEDVLAGSRPATSGAPSLDRLTYPVPSRAGLAGLDRYVRLERNGSQTPAAYVEASRGCLHTCLHCPVTPIYGGRFFAVPLEIVLEDVRQQVAAGAGHVTFGDPDFLNGPTHALRVTRAVHAAFPEITFDFTAKIEHILEHRAIFPELAQLGCVFVVSAVESLSDLVLRHLEKGHVGADVPVALDIVRGAGIALRPSFVAFTPWTTLDDYQDLLAFVHAEELVDQVDPVQFSIRLLVPPGSALLEHAAIRPHLGALDPTAFTYAWTHPDPRMDRLYEDVSDLVERAANAGEGPAETFQRLRDLTRRVAGGRAEPARVPQTSARLRGGAARLTESWFCCAEPTGRQLVTVTIGRSGRGG